MPNKNTIICLSSQNWDNDLWTNKQHIMHRLSQMGYPVVYVRKGISLLGTYLSKWLTGKQTLSGLEHRDKNLSIADSFHLTLFNLLLCSLFYNEFGFKLALLQRFIDSCETTPIIWVYHPGYGHYLHKIKRKCFIIYDCVDDYASFPEYQKQRWNQWIKEGEAQVLKAADLVIATARPLYERLKLLHPNVVYIHNVGDFAHFNQIAIKSLPQPDAIKNLPAPRIAFYGAISSYKVNLELITFLAKSRPQYTFVLIGPIGLSDDSTQVTELQKLKNVQFLGEIDYQRLPEYLAAMDALIIPYRISEHTTHVFPIKFFESLATGKPVLITPLPALKDYFHYTYVAETPDLFLKNLDHALTTDSKEAQTQRIALAKQNDWQSRINKILSAIDTVKKTRPYKIGIDCRPFQDASQYRGIGIYLFNLLKEFEHIMPQRLQFHLIFDKQRPIDRTFINQNFPNFPVIYLSRALSGDEKNKRFDKLGLDLIHFPAQYLTFYPLKTPYLITVHDYIQFILSDIYYQNHKPLLKKHTQRVQTALSKSHCRMIAVSKTTKHDITKLFPTVNDQQITVIYNGLSEHIIKIDKSLSKPIIQKQFKIDSDFILYVGGFDQRKNIILALKAFDLAMAQLKQPLYFVLVGKKESGYMKEIKKTLSAMRFSDRVRFTDHITSETLNHLYSSATLLFFPSLYEGFGLPPLEALKCGTPVLAGDNSSQKELLSDYAYLTDTHSKDILAKNLLKALQSAPNFNSNQATAYARQFTWQKAAQATIAQYLEFCDTL